MKLGKDLKNFGPIHSAPLFDRPPQAAPAEYRGEQLDVLLVLDGSGSVGVDDFNRMRSFCKKVP